MLIENRFEPDQEVYLQMYGDKGRVINIINSNGPAIYEVKINKECIPVNGWVRSLFFENELAPVIEGPDWLPKPRFPYNDARLEMLQEIKCFTPDQERQFAITVMNEVQELMDKGLKVFKYLHYYRRSYINGCKFEPISTPIGIFIKYLQELSSNSRSPSIRVPGSMYCVISIVLAW